MANTREHFLKKYGFDNKGMYLKHPELGKNFLKNVGSKDKWSENDKSDSESEEEEEEYSHPLIRKAPFELRYQKEGYKTLEAWRNSPKYKAEEKIKVSLRKIQRKQENLLYKVDKASKEVNY